MNKEELTLRKTNDLNVWDATLTVYDENGEPEMVLEGYHATPESLAECIKAYLSKMEQVTLTFQ